MTTTVLMVLTSHDGVEGTEIEAGNWLDSIATPYFAFRDAGHQVRVATPTGGIAPIDPHSLTDSSLTRASRRHLEDAESRAAFENTTPLAEIRDGDYGALFYPGSYAMLSDIPSNPDSIHALEHADAKGLPMALVGHGVSALVHAVRPDGRPLVEGRRLTSFSRYEEQTIGWEDRAPMIVEDALRARGALYSCKSDWETNTVADGNLVTGQNPGSAYRTAETLTGLL